MTLIALIRNRWFLLGFHVVFLAALWGAFQQVHRTEILLQRLYRSPEPPDATVAMELYREMMRAGPRPGRATPFYRLAEVLTRADRTEEAIDVWRQLVLLQPEEEATVTRLAIALHNAERYTEAEKYFGQLLKETEGDD